MFDLIARLACRISGLVAKLSQSERPILLKDTMSILDLECKLVIIMMSHSSYIDFIVMLAVANAAVKAAL